MSVHTHLVTTIIVFSVQVICAAHSVNSRYYADSISTFSCIVYYSRIYKCRPPAGLFSKAASSEHVSASKALPLLIFSFNFRFCLLFRRDASICIARISYGNVAGWVAVYHSRYCIKMTKPILKLFRPSGSPIIEAFGTPCADTKFQREPLHRGRLIHGVVRKIGDFRRILPFIS